MGTLRKLTLEFIKNETPARAKAYKIADGGGLTLQVLPSGLKYWRYRYRFQGKPTTVSLGQLANPPTKNHLAEVRKVHQEKAELLARGVNPSQTPAPIKSEPTPLSFEGVALQWWEEWQKEKSVRHAGYVLHRLQRRAFPHIGRMTISDVKRPHIREVLQTAEQDSPIQARRLQADIRNVFHFAFVLDMIPASPLGDVLPTALLTIKKPPKVTNFARIGAEQLPELIRAIKGLDSFFIKRALLLLALTATRTGELIGARWDEINFDAALWTIPASRTKKNRVHVVPLSSPALEILTELFEYKLSGCVFPNYRDKTRPIAPCSMLAALYRLGYAGTMTGHGFRGVFSTMAHNSLAFRHEVIQMALSHLTGDATDQCYDKADYMEDRRRLMDWWGCEITGR